MYIIGGSYNVNGIFCQKFYDNRSMTYAWKPDFGVYFLENPSLFCFLRSKI